VLTAVALLGLIVGLVGVSFYPVLGASFLNWDDDLNFTSNLRWRGLSPAHLRWMFTTLHVGHYKPFTWITFGLDYRLWGMDPAGYHLTNLVWHGVNALLVYAVIARLVRCGGPEPELLACRLGATVGALFFAIHPLRVESVAWLSERNGIHAATFALLSVAAYLRMVDAQNAGRRWLGWYLASVAAFAFSLASKGTAMMLPVVLLVLDVFPLRRGARVVEKLPFLVLSIGAVVLSTHLVHDAPATRTLAEHGVLARAAQSAYGLAFYLRKTLVPVGLSPLYVLERRLDPWRARYVVAGIVTLALSAIAYRARRRAPWLCAAWVAYVAILLPVLGVVQRGPQIAADRYTYLGCLPWAVLVGAAGRRVAIGVTGRPLVGAAALGAAALAVVTLGSLTFRQAGVWRDSETLWNEALRLDPRNQTAHLNRGWALQGRGDLVGAVRDYNAALAIDPYDVLALIDRGSVRQELGDLEGAIADYSAAIRARPDVAVARYDRGLARQLAGDLDAALEDYAEAIRLGTDDPRAYLNHGSLLAKRGDLDAAIADFDVAIRLVPDLLPAYLGRGRARRAKGDATGAAADLARALELSPEGSPTRDAIAREMAAPGA
jgi:tetratricopeptide (TPR) repeat protein